MKYKAIIFDLDGVICHTDHYHYLAWKQLADKIGVYFDETINNRLRGVSRMESLEIILERLEGKILFEEEKTQLAEEKNAIYKELLLGMSTKDLSEEVKDTLNALRSEGLKLAIGSSSKNARLILTQIGLANYFDAISDGNNITRSKPHPEVFLKAAEYLGFEPCDCLVVEDAKAGIEAAVAAGMDSAAIGDACGYPLATYELPTFATILSVVN
jgi:beta-phosphoglucomutase